jgi:hypothetical protein
MRRTSPLPNTKGKQPAHDHRELTPDFLQTFPRQFPRMERHDVTWARPTTTSMVSSGGSSLRTIHVASPAYKSRTRYMVPTCIIMLHPSERVHVETKIPFFSDIPITVKNFNLARRSCKKRGGGARNIRQLKS